MCVIAEHSFSTLALSVFARGHLSLPKVAHGYACIKLSSTSGAKMGRRNLFILLRQ